MPLGICAFYSITQTARRLICSLLGTCNLRLLIFIIKLSSRKTAASSSLYPSYYYCECQSAGNGFLVFTPFLLKEFQKTFPCHLWFSVGFQPFQRCQGSFYKAGAPGDLPAGSMLGRWGARGEQARSLPLTVLSHSNVMQAIG